jgi:uncharacterized repeat protein (TIGR03803 family)
MGESSLPKTVSVIFMFCAAAVIASPAQTFTTLVDFDLAKGVNPQSSLIQGTDGNFYGTTYYGGSNGHGTVFKITPEGTLTTLHAFCAQTSRCFDGISPPAGLVQATDGNFYGTTEYGGVNGLGTVFKITSGGMLTSLYSFCAQTGCTDGIRPSSGVIQGTDGNLYGTTYYGGGNGLGSVFKITPGGMLTTLYSFCAQPDCTDGISPSAGVIQGVDGNFYGTTPYGGTNGLGAVFKITPEGMLTTLYSFCAETDCTDGNNPSAGVVQGTDGNFYGTTYYGGANNLGAVFKITPGGMLTTLYSFCAQTDCTDGISPSTRLVQATDASFYGTTYYGGANGLGTIFKITPSRLLKNYS